MSFGEVLVQMRKKNKISQEKLAEAIGVSSRTVRTWERENRIPQEKGILLKISKFFGCEVETLINDENISDEGYITPAYILNATSALFAGGQLSDEDKKAFMSDIQELYITSKINAKKFRKKGDKNES